MGHLKGDWEKKPNTTLEIHSLRVLRTNKRYPLEKYIHLIISPVRMVELKLSFKHIMFGNKCERQ